MIKMNCVFSIGHMKQVYLHKVVERLFIMFPSNNLFRMEQNECECPCECPLEVNECTGNLTNAESR